MDIFSALPYTPGTLPKNPGPLARFLPPLEDGAAAAWLVEHVPAGAWVLDPFGASPQLAVEAARAGYRVLVAANNPVLRFLLEMTADPLPESDFKAALAELAVSRKGDERLEAHLQALYQTECAKCQRTVTARAFLWRKDARTPFARVYECPACGDAGERLTTPADDERAAAAAAGAGLPRARVLERVAPLNDPDREYVEDALDHYLPRAIYAVGTLLNRLDGLSLSPERRRALTALLLTASDAANTLWPHPTERPRPRQLTVPGQFYENNVWLAIEEGIDAWTDGGASVQLATWPGKLPENGGICLFEGRLKDLAVHLDKVPIRAVLTALPRPNQAFWTLSALWAGWLWGQDAVEPFKAALRRRRYDWAWHAAALQSVMRPLFELLAPESLVFGLLAEPEPSFLSAALAAAAASGFGLQGLALRTVHDPLQILWQRGDLKMREEIASPAARSDMLGWIQSAVGDYLRAQGEPATYLHLHAVSLTALAGHHGLLPSQGALDESLTRLNAAIHAALLGDGRLIRYEGSEHNLEVGLWGLRTEGMDGGRVEPLPDRVEMAVVRFLGRNPGCALIEIERDLYSQFPGLFTPPKVLVGAVLESYGVAMNGGWRLRDEDAPSARRADLEEMAALVGTIGGRLGYATRRAGERLLLWGDEAEPAYAFYLLASAIVGRILVGNPYPLARSLIVLPGGRAGLLAYKQRRDPLLRQASQGWRFVKFRLLRALAEIPVINRQTWEEQVNSDPIEGAPPGQMMMF